MELIKELLKQESAKSNESFRILNTVKCGKYRMSVQGSTGHCCSPRMTLPINEYREMELALFNKKGWFCITKSKKLKAFPRYNELLEKANNINDIRPIFIYVPVDLLNDLYIYLSKIQ